MSPPQTFEQWLAEVDKLLIARVGLDSGSLEDWYWMDHYQDDIPAFEAVDWFLLENRLTA
jgi:hypothetical protein